jgi:hypothetical protein
MAEEFEGLIIRDCALDAGLSLRSEERADGA